jgi:hypothetical protein
MPKYDSRIVGEAIAIRVNVHPEGIDTVRFIPNRLAREVV